MSAPGWASEGREPSIAIIGAGMSGIAAVVKLRKAGYTDLTVYEKADRVGGTWRQNSYPGLSCDVPSRWYSLSFARNPDWEHRFAYGAEIQAYLEKVATDHGVNEVVRFEKPVSRIVYEEPTWRLETADGEERRFDVVISATGILNEPAIPDIEGLDGFAGACFHSSRWDHSVDLAGKRVGVIGTGSTASQVVGEITDQVAEMHVFQRTPQWMLERPQKRYSKLWRGLLRTFPFLQEWACKYWIWVFLRVFAPATIGDAKAQAKLHELCRKHLEKQVEDPELRARLTPTYQAGCKRLIFCSDFYPAITSEHAHLITERIERIDPKGVQTADGTLHELDVLVLATGYDSTRFILPTRVTGEHGRDLATFWGDEPKAHRAVAVPGFPNFWMLEGPTGPVGNLALTSISENQLDYIISMLDKMKAESLAAIAVKEEAFASYNEAVGEAIQGTLWVTGGCHSWYMGKTGVPNLYPWHPFQYVDEMQNPDYSEFRLVAETAEPAAAHAA